MGVHKAYKDGYYYCYTFREPQDGEWILETHDPLVYIGNIYQYSTSSPSKGNKHIVIETDDPNLL